MLTQNLQGRRDRKQFHIITMNCPKTKTKQHWVLMSLLFDIFQHQLGPHLTEISDDLVFSSNNRIVNKMKCYVSFHHLLSNDEIWLQVVDYKMNCPQLITKQQLELLL